jgi:hypothetical protein
MMRKEMRVLFPEILESLKLNGSTQGFLIDESGCILKLVGKLDKESLD